MKYSDEYINTFRSTIKELGFVGCSWMDVLSNEQIREAINGIGSAAMGATLRKALDKLHPSLVFASHVHDCFWQYMADGGDKDFHESNNCFEINGILMAKSMYGWYNPIRYVAVMKAKEFRKILDSAGYIAYLSACKENG